MTTITIKEYFAAEGALYSNKDARVIGPILDELSEGGAVTARDVVDAARSPQSPIHTYFEWDDKVAADHWRIETARRMLRSIKVKYIEQGEGANGERQTLVREARAFHVQKHQAYEPEPRKYRTFQVLHGDSAFAAQMMDDAFQGLIAWRRKYEAYTQLWKNFGDTFQAVLNQISEWEEEFPTEQAALETDNALTRLLEWREENAAILQTWTQCREQIEFIMSAIGDAERMFAKLDERKHRDCLKCGRSFLSVGSGNRICKTCLNGKTVNERNIDNVGTAMIGGG